MMESTNSKVLQGQKTHQNLLSIARNLFATQGYANTTMEQVINQGKLTKGALYHHFKSKKQLFEAVYIEVEHEIAGRIEQASSSSTDLWQRLLSGCFAYLDASSDQGLQQILRVDALSVLGLSRWREIDQEFGVNRLQPFLQYLSDTNIIDVPSVEAFTHQLSGAMNEATFWIANHQDPDTALEKSKLSLQKLLLSVKHN